MQFMDEQNILPEKNDEGRSWSWKKGLGLLFILLAGIATVYIIVAYFAWQSGLSMRLQREEAQRVEQFAHQVELAQDDIGQGNYNLAIRRLDWILDREPDNKEAQALRSQAQAAIKTALTPAAPPSPTPNLEPSPTPGNIVEPDAELSRLQRLARQERWEDLLPAVIVFQRQFPDFKRIESDGLLYDAFLNLGLFHIQGNQIELGINYLSQAEKLRDLSQEALDYWLWAELYLEGIAYYGVNWGVSASFFRDLCLSAPFYQNACDKLLDSLVAQGEQYIFAEDFCPAVDLFREARQYNRTPELNELLDEAIQGCALATPTPNPITGTLPITGTAPLASPTVDE